MGQASRATDRRSSLYWTLCSGASRGARIILRTIIVFSRTPGVCVCVITQAVRQGCWKDRNDEKPKFKLATNSPQPLAVLSDARPRRRVKPRPCTALPSTSGKRQGGRRKTLTYPAGALISMFSQFRKRGRLAPVREFEQIIPFMASLACSEAVRRFEPMNGPDPGNERGDRLGDLNL
jgi:hypothetical protein